MLIYPMRVYPTAMNGYWRRATLQRPFPCCLPNATPGRVCSLQMSQHSYCQGLHTDWLLVLPARAYNHALGMQSSKRDTSSGFAAVPEATAKQTASAHALHVMRRDAQSDRMMIF